MALHHLYHGIDVDHGHTMVLTCIIHFTMAMHNYDTWYQKLSYGTPIIICVPSGHHSTNTYLQYNIHVHVCIDCVAYHVNVCL